MNRNDQNWNMKREKIKNRWEKCEITLSPQYYICVCVESKKEGAKEIFEKIMTKNFTKLVKDTELQQIQEAQRENLKATTTKRHYLQEQS